MYPQLEVRKPPLIENVDSPEGLFDGVMQAVVCQKQVGWREDAHHLLVVSTDASFHYAGDGKVSCAVILTKIGILSTQIEYFCLIHNLEILFLN